MRKIIVTCSPNIHIGAGGVDLDQNLDLQPHTNLQEGIELRFALVQELLVNGLEGQFAERRQLQLLQRWKTLRTQEGPGSAQKHQVQWSTLIMSGVHQSKVNYFYVIETNMEVSDPALPPSAQYWNWQADSVACNVHETQ